MPKPEGQQPPWLDDDFSAILDIVYGKGNIIWCVITDSTSW